MIQILLSGKGQKMDPLVSLYYYAPVCTVMNFVVAAFMELGSFKMDDVWNAGVILLLLNAAVAFMLNVASVFLVRISSPVMFPASMERNPLWCLPANHQQIGKTSGLILMLGSVSKNILLVVASVVFWGTIISPLQMLGYSIATAALVYYSIGYEGFVAHYNTAKQLWEKEGGVVSGNWVSRIVVWTLYAAGFLLLVTGVAVKSGNAPDFLMERLPYF